MTVIETIHKIGRLVFTTREISSLTGISAGSVTQTLSRLERQGVVKKILRGVWAIAGDRHFSPLIVIPYLAPNHRTYLSFISALNVHGVIGQIPQVITVASTAHTKIVRTPVGTFHLHRISPDLFDGFTWNRTEDYLIATPEKALVDCLYLASRKKNQFAHFPEMDIGILNGRKIREWAGKIRNARIRKNVLQKIDAILTDAP